MVGRGRGKNGGSWRASAGGQMGAFSSQSQDTGGFWDAPVTDHGTRQGQVAPSGRGHTAPATGAVGRGRQSGLKTDDSTRPGQKNSSQSKKPETNTSNDSQDGERRFAAACKEIQASVDKYMATHQFEESSEEEEDVEFEEDTLLDKVYQSYGCERDMGSTYQYLQDAFKNGALICLICIENVKKNEAIWNCQGCYSSFHIPCVQKWAKDSIYHQAESQTESNTHVDRAAFNWFCPKCRSEYPQRSIPTKYSCFCGKQTDPVFDPWLVPHSCGNNCGKKLKPECGHKCLLLCHPGPCPPCPKTVTNSCHCGKEKPQSRRCCAKEWSCGKACGHVLSCGQHPCEEACHSGTCKPCPRQSHQPCHCGASIILRNCAEPEWQCEKVCGKKYSCGHHTCKEICHSGSCGDCPATGERKCPCGKTSHSLPCTREIPNCGDTCDKLLVCGVHYCAERCHKGSCPNCLQYRVKRCRCGALEKDMACGKLFTCERKCKRMKDCRRHPCNRKCCTGDCPMCEVPCGRQLGCRNHKCESRCHEGPCYPCPLTFTITCTCGGTKITVPCGREKTIQPPKCGKKCRKPPICHHPEQRVHRCHPGACPTCKINCGLELSCGHICPVACHDNVPVKIVDRKKRAGPWERSEGTKIQIQKKPCPPCQVDTCIDHGFGKSFTLDCNQQLKNGNIPVNIPETFSLKLKQSLQKESNLRANLATPMKAKNSQLKRGTNVLKSAFECLNYPSMLDTKTNLPTRDHTFAKNDFSFRISKSTHLGSKKTSQNALIKSSTERITPFMLAQVGTSWSTEKSSFTTVDAQDQLKRHKNRNVNGSTTPRLGTSFRYSDRKYNKNAFYKKDSTTGKYTRKFANRKIIKNLIDKGNGNNGMNKFKSLATSKVGEELDNYNGREKTTNSDGRERHNNNDDENVSQHNNINFGSSSSNIRIRETSENKNMYQRKLREGKMHPRKFLTDQNVGATRQWKVNRERNKREVCDVTSKKKQYEIAGNKRKRYDEIPDTINVKRKSLNVDCIDGDGFTVVHSKKKRRIDQ